MTYPDWVIFDNVVDVIDACWPVPPAGCGTGGLGVVESLAIRGGSFRLWQHWAVCPPFLYYGETNVALSELRRTD